MSDKKQYVINNSSLVDLKAELLRKQQQFQKDKTGSLSFVKARTKEKKTDIWSKSNVGVGERSQRDLEAKQEEEDAMAKSRKMLEKKAKLYESMASGKTISEEDGSKVFLVDFEQKSISKIAEDRCRQRDVESRRAEMEESQVKAKADEEDVRKLFLKESVPEPQDPGEEWVDYTDSLGRSRRCMKKDLPELMEMDRNLTNKINTEATESEPDLMSADMYREKLREKWEKEEREAMEGPVGPVHYANVQYDEIRTHGVGFYQFDKKQEAREEQLEELNKLREETKDKRAAHQRLKDKRKAMVAARLAKVRQRKAIREGKDPIEALDTTLNSDESDDDIIGPKLEEKEPEPAPLTRDDSWRKDAPVREWDKGKEELEDFLGGRNIKSESQWQENLRKQRNPEFAPPSIYKAEDKRSRPQQSTKLTIGKKSWANPMETFDEIRKNPGGFVENSRGLFPPPASLKTGGTANPGPSAGFINNAGGSKSAGVSSIRQPNKGLGDMIGSTLSAIRAEVDGQQPNSLTKQNTQSSFTKTSARTDLSDIPLPPSMPSTGKIEKLFKNSEELVETPIVEEIAVRDISKPIEETLANGNKTLEGHAQLKQTSAAIFVEPYTYGSETQTGNIVHSSQDIASCNSQPTSESKRAYASVSVEGSHNVPNTVSQTATSQPSTLETPQSGITSAEPQPAHYSSGPMKPQPKKPRYERINLHELPPTLPAPPTMSNVPEYPSQEEIFGPLPKKANKPMTEEQAVKSWKRQFDDSKKNLKPTNIPFASPYIKNQDQDSTTNKDPAIEYDPEKPPPSLSK